MFMMRFDMRAPDFGAPTSELYAAALEMATFAEGRGAVVAMVCEHHTMADGYLPSPLVLATAMAARTTSLSIMTAALILPLYDPIRLAEDMVVLDIISGGRVSYVMVNGHEPGFCMIPPTDLATTVFVADDLDAAWAELGPHLLHDVRAYAAINEGNTHTASLSPATTVEELRAEDRSHRIVTVDDAIAMIKGGMPLALQPLVVGLPPEIAWRYLRTVTDDVMPRL